jgi:hypothetical protein
MDIMSDVVKNKSLLILLTESEYEKRLSDILEQVEKSKSKICYVCLSTPYAEVIERFKKKGIDPNKFFFVDVMSSHYAAPRDAKDCIFVSGPTALEEIRAAIKKAIDEKHCSIVMFDTISSLLIYQQSDSILHFTNRLVSSREHENTSKVFIVLKDMQSLESEIQLLTKDMKMFADKMIEV